VRTMVYITVCFTLCWMPLYFYYLLSTLKVRHMNFFDCFYGKFKSLISRLLCTVTAMNFFHSDACIHVSALLSPWHLPFCRLQFPFIPVKEHMLKRLSPLRTFTYPLMNQLINIYKVLLKIALNIFLVMRVLSGLLS